MSDHDRIQKKIRAVIKFFGADFFKGIKVLDIGSGDGTVARAFADMGALVTCVDARKPLLDAIYTSNPKIRCIRADLDQEWPFHHDFFDLTLHLGTLNHLMYLEKHLSFVCQNTNYMVLDTQVCDSSKPNKYILVKENKHVNTNSYSGVGCKPSPAFVERVLDSFSMQYEQLEDDSCNYGKFIYDWVGKNSNSVQFGLSRMWFIRKKELRTVTQESREAATKTLPRWRPPPVTLSSLRQRQVQGNQDSETSVNRVRQQSRNFAITQKDNRVAEQTFTTSGVILPLTASSKSWYQKIEPYFPNLRLHHMAHTMQGYSKSKANPDLIMTSIDNLMPCKRVWIEEWSNYRLTTEDVSILSRVDVIMTPSLLNEHELRHHLPNSLIIKVNRPWPALNAKTESKGNFVYLEKIPEFTKMLAEGWNKNWGELVVIGGTSKIPAEIRYISDMDSYEEVFTAISEAKCLIDFSPNNYYKSGLIDLAKSLGLSIITNNYYDMKSYQNLISYDAAGQIVPDIREIESLISRAEISTKDPNLTANHLLNNSLVRMLTENA